jgi:hypothetical protein
MGKLKFRTLMAKTISLQTLFRRLNNNIKKKIIIIRNGAKAISLQTLFGRRKKISHSLQGTTGQNFMKLGGVIDICF